MASIYDHRNGEIESERRIRRERIREAAGAVALAALAVAWVVVLAAA